MVWFAAVVLCPLVMFFGAFGVSVYMRDVACSLLSIAFLLLVLAMAVSYLV